MTDHDIIPVSRREQVRARVNEAAPRNYSPWFHLLFPSLCGIAIVAACAWFVRDVRLWQLGFIPLWCLVINAAEWWIHSDLLHRRTPGFTVLYDQHTPIHHHIFVTEDMAIRSWRELRLVLIPPFGIFGVLAAALPFLVGFTLLGQRNLGLFATALMIGYAVVYEWLHLAYHLPEESAIGRNPVIRWLRRHHAAHHDPRLMQRWNFNVTIPLWDWVMGTIHGHERQEKQAAVRRADAAR